MEPERTRFMEHLAASCPLSLREFCDAVKRRLELPEFEFDSENETEWGLVEQDGIEYNVSRPYKRGTLEEWDSTVPKGCNFGVTLVVTDDGPPDRTPDWSARELVPRVGQALADLLGVEVTHHRTWLGIGRNAG